MAKLDDIRAARHQASPLTINDPRPVAEVSQVWRTAAQSATIGIFIILLIAALDQARPILLPAASAFVVTMMLGPLSARAGRFGIPTVVTAIVLWLLVVVVFYGVIVLLSAPVVDWVGKAPDVGRNIQEKLRVLERPLAALQEMRNALLPTDATGGIGFDIVSVVRPSRSSRRRSARYLPSSARCSSCCWAAPGCAACWWRSSMIAMRDYAR